MPDFFWMYFAMMELAPPMAGSVRMREFVTWWCWEDELVEAIRRGIEFANAASAKKS